MPSRPRAWGDLNVSILLVEDTTQSIDLLANLTASDTITVVRLVGRLMFMPNSLSAQVSGAMRLDLGIGVSAKEAFDASPKVLPDADNPADQPARGWLYKNTMLTYKEHDAGAADILPMHDVLSFDIRAARKVDRGTCYATFVTDTAIGTGFDTRLVGTIRALCLT